MNDGSGHLVLKIMSYFALMVFLASLNANGLRTASKMVSIMSTLTCDILCLQETKWDQSKAMELGKLWKGSMYVSNIKNMTCGVAILLGP